MRKVFLITERRADYSRFQPILKKISSDPDLDYDLVVTGMHLKQDHGFTLNEIKDDGFKVFASFQMFLEDIDTGGSMVRAYGEAVKKVTFELEKSKPDIILSGFDIAANAAVGCPSIDAIKSVKRSNHVLKKFKLTPPYFLLIQHPVTSEIDDVEEHISTTLSAIKSAGVNTLIILPNNDAGYSGIMSSITSSKIKLYNYRHEK